jgi:hypothetical protein
MEGYKISPRLDQLCKQVSHNRKVKIIRMWYGCSRDLWSGHFSVYHEVDNSHYGKAIYFTSNAKYATRRSCEHGCLIMCYILTFQFHR